MPKKQELTDIDAIDILKNEIADYVIGDWCISKQCPVRKECIEKQKECKYEQAIDRVIVLIGRKNTRISELLKENRTLKEQIKEKK